MNETKINNLIAAGAKRWTKGNMDRLYINHNALIAIAKEHNILGDYTWNGIISNRYMRQLSSTKTYIDISDGAIHTSDKLLKAAAEIMYSVA